MKKRSCEHYSGKQPDQPMLHLNLFLYQSNRWPCVDLHRTCTISLHAPNNYILRLQVIDLGVIYVILRFDVLLLQSVHLTIVATKGSRLNVPIDCNHQVQL